MIVGWFALKVMFKLCTMATQILWTILRDLEVSVSAQLLIVVNNICLGFLLSAISAGWVLRRQVGQCNYFTWRQRSTAGWRPKVKKRRCKKMCSSCPQPRLLLFCHPKWRGLSFESDCSRYLQHLWTFYKVQTWKRRGNGKRCLRGYYVSWVSKCQWQTTLVVQLIFIPLLTQKSNAWRLREWHESRDRGDIFKVVGLR